jgi:hypothetical protein
MLVRFSDQKSGIVIEIALCSRIPSPDSSENPFYDCGDSKQS